MDSGAYSVAIQDPSMLANPRPGIPSIGINGMKIQQGHLYFVNLVEGTLCKIPINPSTGAATGPVNMITTSIFGADDFALDASGTPYIAENPFNELLLVKPNGATQVLAGDPQSAALIGATSAAFGRTANDAKTIYVTTCGGLAAPINQTYTEGAKVVAVQLK
jgi:hypothetical protein